MQGGRVRAALVGALAVAAGLTAIAAQPASAAGATIKITSPADGSTVDGGRFGVEGTFAASDADGVNVIYVVDVSGSTASPTGQDCNGDGKSDSFDNINSAGATGDTLDCEISGVLALNASIRNRSNVEVALIPFGSSASAANLDGKSGLNAVFVPPGSDRDDDRSGTADLVQAAGSMTQGNIALFSSRSVGTGTNFDNAVTELLRVKALGRFSRTVAFFLSDGESSVTSSTLSSLTASGAEVQTYAIGAGSGCQTDGPLDRIAKATKQVCTKVANPASLQGVLGAGQPSALDRIEVSTDGTTKQATVDALGNWSVEFTGVATGSKSITAKAFLKDGTSTTASVTVTVAKAGRTYVALGDSFSAGHGVTPFLNGSPSDPLCQRSTKAYSQQVKFPGESKPIAQDTSGDAPLMRFVACTGAVIANFDATKQDMEETSANDNIALQVDALGPEVDLVTMTFGGNDGGFAQILSHCFWQFDCQNDGFARLSSGKDLRLVDWIDVRIRLLQIDLVQLYRSVKADTSGKARVVVLTYPRLFRQSNAAQAITCDDAVVFGPKERDFLSDTIVKFAGVIKTAAEQAGIDVVDVIERFRGHEICSGDPWILNGSKFLTTQRPGGPAVYHPNEKGTAEYAKLINAHLQKLADSGVSFARAAAIEPLPRKALMQPMSLAQVSPVDTLTPEELAEIRGLELDNLSLASISGLKDPDSLCPSSAVPSQQLALSGGGFRPGSTVRLTFKAANEESRRPYRDLVAGPDGSVAAWVVVPTNASANPSDAETISASPERFVGAGFQLEGTGRSGNARRLSQSFYLKAPNSDCGRFARDTGQLSINGQPAPGTDGSGFQAPVVFTTAPQAANRGGTGLAAGAADTNGDGQPDTVLSLTAQSSAGGVPVRAAFILAGQAAQFRSTSVLSAAFSVDGAKRKLVVTGEGTFGPGAGEKRLFRAEVESATLSFLGIALSPTVKVCAYQAGQSCGSGGPGVFQFSGPIRGVASLSPSAT